LPDGSENNRFRYVSDLVLIDRAEFFHARPQLTLPARELHLYVGNARVHPVRGGGSGHSDERGKHDLHCGCTARVGAHRGRGAQVVDYESATTNRTMEG